MTGRDRRPTGLPPVRARATALGTSVLPNEGRLDGFSTLEVFDYRVEGIGPVAICLRSSPRPERPGDIGLPDQEPLVYALAALFGIPQASLPRLQREWAALLTGFLLPEHQEATVPAPIRPDPAKVQMYWRPGCPYCAILRRQLRRTGLSYEPVDIWKDQSGAAYIRSVNNGNETVPTVAVAGHPLTNPSTRQVLEAVRRHTPHLLPETAPADAARRWRPRWPWRRTT